MNHYITSHLTIEATKAAVYAGKEIIKIYNQEYSTTLKEDKSPLTTADIKAHDCIVELLAGTDLPILSEEGKNIPWKVRNKWNLFWLVDPLDGTKEFISRNGEFTVNIALIADHKPVIGVIYIPVTGMLYFGNKEIGSYCIDCFKNPVVLVTPDLSSLIGLSTKLPMSAALHPVVILASRSHLSVETSKIIDQIKNEFHDCEIINTGSSLKFCRLAAGNAHYYPRFSPTMEWDTAAGHAIAGFAGIEIKSWPDLQAMYYNKESLVNPWFIAHQRGFPDFAE